MRAPLLAVLLALPLAAVAQGDWRQDRGPAPTVRADLDGDGSPESYALRRRDDGSVDLAVEGPDGGAGYPGLAWMGGMAGQEPHLEVTEGGSLRVVSMNDSVGRDRWMLTLTVAHRDGALRVAGLTYDWRDTLDLAAGGTCDLNLLTGRGTVAGASSGRAPTPVRVAGPPAPRLEEWPALEARFLSQCGDAG